VKRAVCIVAAAILALLLAACKTTVTIGPWLATCDAAKGGVMTVTMVNTSHGPRVLEWVKVELDASAGGGDPIGDVTLTVGGAPVKPGHSVRVQYAEGVNSGEGPQNCKVIRYSPTLVRRAGTGRGWVKR